MKARRETSEIPLLLKWRRFCLSWRSFVEFFSHHYSKLSCSRLTDKSIEVHKRNSSFYNEQTRNVSQEKFFSLNVLLHVHLVVVIFKKLCFSLINDGILERNSSRCKSFCIEERVFELHWRTIYNARDKFSSTQKHEDWRRCICVWCNYLKLFVRPVITAFSVVANGREKSRLKKFFFFLFPFGSINKTKPIKFCTT